MIDFTTISSLIFVFAVGVAVGTDVKWTHLTRTLQRATKPFFCGIACQFVLMPLFALLLSVVLQKPLEEFAYHNLSSASLGFLIPGCLPGGSTSNLFTYFVGGNVPLSIVMSFVSNVAALGFMPLMLFLLYDLRFAGDAQAVEIPYFNMIFPLILTVCALGVGMLCRARLSENTTWWVAKSCTVFSIVFLLLAIVVGLLRYQDIILSGDWTIWVAALTLQPVGYVAGMCLARLLGLGLQDQMTIAFETGVQNFPLGMALAQLSFDFSEGSDEEGIFKDTFKYSAICGLLYSVHAFWLVLLFRKFLPKGLRRVSAYYPSEDWGGHAHKAHTEQALQSDSEAEIECPPAGSSSLAAEKSLPPRTLPQVFKEAVSRRGPCLALAVERNVPASVNGKAHPSLPWKDWSKWTWAEYMQDVERAAAGLVALGVEQFGTVSIYGFNSPEWSIAGMATIHAGAKVCGIYPTDTNDNIIWKTNHSVATVALMESSSKARWHLEKSPEMPALKAIVAWDRSKDLEASPNTSSVRAHAWEQFMQLGTPIAATALSQRIEAQKPGHCAALVYTSGTSGKPKAVMTSHDNLVFSSWLLTHVFRDIMCVSPGEEGRLLSYLPLSHIAGFMIDVVVPIMATSRTKGYYSVYFARKTDLKEGTLIERLRVARPTIFFGVPRVWEKMEERLKEIGKRTTGWLCCFKKKDVAAWAKRQGLATTEALQVGESGRTSAFYGLAEATVLDNVKYALGLDECRHHVSGAAPISLETKRYFASLGIVIHEAFGMSESTGVGLMSTDKRYHLQSWGFAPPGVQVKLLAADGKGTVGPAKDLQNPKEEEQGEICIRGRCVMMGYFVNTALGEEHVSETLKQTLEAVDAEGWLHTGDKGCMDKHGMFRITGRFKELIIGAGGENVAPVPIENKIKEMCPALSNVMMIGDQRKYNIVVVTLKVKGADGENPGTSDLAGLALEVNPAVKTTSEAMKDTTWREYVEAGINAANKDQTVCPNNASKVQKFAILPRDFSIQTGELTPSLKLRRSVAAQTWKDEIDRLYDEMHDLVL